MSVFCSSLGDGVSFPINTNVLFHDDLDANNSINNNLNKSNIGVISHLTNNNMSQFPPKTIQRLI